jgi:AIPR protein
MISLEQFEAQWLEDVKAGQPSTTQLGHRFAEKLLRDWHEIDSSSSEIILCDGAGDGGIDAAVFVKGDPSEGLEGDTWLLVQSKYGSAYGGADTIGIEAQKVFATLEGKREGLSGLSTELVSRLRNFISNMGPKDRLDYILATTSNLSFEDASYLDNVKLLGQAKFGPGFDVDAVSIETIYRKLEEATPAHSDKLSISLKTDLSKSGDLYIGSTLLIELFAFMKSYKAATGDLDLLYEKNVRKFLGSRKKVNKGIERTLDLYPERFGLYNNGITIVAESAKLVDGTVHLVSPYVVNGCQTTRSIWAVLQKRWNSGGSSPSQEQKAWEDRLHRAVVVTKIVAVGPEGEDLLTETTRFTNSQNTVSEKDFIALEEDFRRWTPQFNSRFGVFLEIQRGAWEARRAFQRQNPAALPRFETFANAFDLLKAYAAGWLTEPGIAFGKNPPFAPGGSLFNKIVNSPDFGVDSLYAAHLVSVLANSYEFGRGAKVATRGQTRFLFIMVTVDMVKDILVNLGLDYSARSIARAVVCLEASGGLKRIGDSAIQLIDDYLTVGNDDSLFTEPEFQKSQDLNSFLKSEKLGKSEEFSPKLKMQMAMAKKIFRRTADMEALSRQLKACLSESQEA